MTKYVNRWWSWDKNVDQNLFDKDNSTEWKRDLFSLYYCNCDMKALKSPFYPSGFIWYLPLFFFLCFDLYIFCIKRFLGHCKWFTSCLLKVKPSKNSYTHLSNVYECLSIDEQMDGNILVAHNQISNKIEIEWINSSKCLYLLLSIFHSFLLREEWESLNLIFWIWWFQRFLINFFCNPEAANNLSSNESFIGICVKAESDLFQTEFGRANSRIVQLYWNNGTALMQWNAIEGL